MPTPATHLVETLQDLGTELVFGLPGVHNLAIWKALSASPIRLVGVRHEQAAVYAADGYARATGHLGIALVTTGPGAANTLGATGEAMASSSPVLVIATDIPSTLRRHGAYRGALHETRDQAAMFGPVTKLALTASEPSEIGTLLRRAARTALAPNSGPVYLGIPTDFLTREVPATPPPPVPRPPNPPLPSAADLDRATTLINDADRPVIWAGGGAVRSGAGESVGRLAQGIGAPVITTYMSRGLLPPDHPRLVPGPAHAPEVGAIWDGADLVIAVGSDFDGMMTQNWLMPQPRALININIDRDEAEKNYRPDVSLIGDARSVLDELIERLGDRQSRGTWGVDLVAIGAQVRRSVQVDEPGAAAMLDIFGRRLPEDAVLVADMCIPGYWLAGFHRVSGPRRFAYPMGWGTLGFAFPASLGSALAGTGPAVCVTGDGGFLFACGELATVAQEQIPVVIVLFDDGGYGMLRFDQTEVGDEPFGVDLVGPDFAALAGSFGIPCQVVDGIGSGMERALKEALDLRAPQMIVVRARLKPPPTTSPRWYRRREA